MLAPFLIMLREGIEAALIVGIIAGYLRQTGRGGWLTAVWAGVFLAIAASLFAGAGLELLSAGFPQKLQEGFEAAVGTVAVAMLLFMVLWMKRAARSLKGAMHDGIDDAFSSAGGATWALVGMAFFAVAREGLESVFFLLAIFQQSPGIEGPAGALAGIAVAAVLGAGLYLGGLRMDLRRFFRWTGAFIILVAAGLSATVLGNLHEAGIWNHLQTPLWDLSRALPDASALGTVLGGVLGYDEALTRGQALVWVLVCGLGLWAFLRPAGAPRRAVAVP
ncbi:iron uptake transporter permease EfeU [Frigidibacter sp. MR17.24]|uniref:iron uptake transporter permease EfeU n=1 Tax=Frigidibacter sp. MR17.24 TaxID=3127345 RepID=UPI003012A1B1